LRNENLLILQPLEERLHTTPDVSFVTWPRVFLFLRWNSVTEHPTQKPVSNTRSCISWYSAVLRQFSQTIRQP